MQALEVTSNQNDSLTDSVLWECHSASSWSDRAGPRREVGTVHRCLARKSCSALEAFQKLPISIFIDIYTCAPALKCRHSSQRDYFTHHWTTIMPGVKQTSIHTDGLQKQLCMVPVSTLISPDNCLRPLYRLLSRQRLTAWALSEMCFHTLFNIAQQMASLCFSRHLLTMSISGGSKLWESVFCLPRNGLYL